MTSLGENLLEHGHSGSSLGAEAAMYSSLALVLLIGVFSMCVKGCRKTRISSQITDDAELDQGEAGNSHSIKTVETDLNGDANGRPLSHDRALPEIPAASSGVTSTDDDDEEDEGHYDIISKNKKKDLLVSSLAVPSTSSSSAHFILKSKKRSHPYEIVHGDPDSDSVYAGIKDDGENGAGVVVSNYARTATLPKTLPTLASMESVASSNGHSLASPGNAQSGGHSNIYATVGGSRHNQNNESQIYPDSGFSCGTQNVLLSLSNNLAENGANGGGAAAAIGSHALVPPVPLKMYNSDEEGLTGRTASNPLNGSPSLPPRNGDIVTGAVVNGSENRMSDGNGIRISALMPSMPWTAMAVYPSLIIDGSTARTVNMGSSQQQTAEVTTAKRVPDYSSVTARESLENLRKRQQQQRQQAIQIEVSQFPDIDGTYDTINYDQVKIPATSAAAGHTSANVATVENVYSNGSDLYAEIGTENNSARSSAYARVGDLSIPASSSISDYQPPAPPPVNTLQQLTHPVNIDDLADPGYSRVDIMRPKSVHSTSSGGVVTAGQQQPVVGQRSPMYAVVNKSRHTNRQTIHIDEDVERGFRTELPVDNLYAKVSKPKSHRRTSSSSATLTQNEAPPVCVPFGGARPKVRSQGVSLGHEVGIGRNNHSYASIGSGVNRVGHTEDPEYDVVKDNVNTFDGLPEYDPNYETVAGSSHVNTAPDSVRSLQPGVALEIASANRDVQMRRPGTVNITAGASQVWQLPRREHIYEVVKDKTDERLSDLCKKDGFSTAVSTDL